MDSNKKECIGIDVSKETLDIYWRNKSFKIRNNSKEIFNFIKLNISNERNILCVLEATGGYEREAVMCFKKLSIPVHVAHPSKVHAFAKADNHFAKTDKLDAILLWKYAKFISSDEQGDTMINKVQDDLHALRNLKRSLEKNLHACQCRLKQMPKICSKYLNCEILLYKKQISSVQKEIDNKIDNDPTLKSKRDIMMTMKGVGKTVASTLLAELPELGNISRRKISKLVGLAPKTYQSGKKYSRGYICGGRFFARKAIYMSALVATQHDKSIIARYKMLQEKGKQKKVALVAIMRKMIITLNAMLRDNKVFA